MLFNSYEFLLAFFPATLALYWLLTRVGGRAPHLVLLIASLCFYAWWDVRFVALLVASFLINFAAGQLVFALVQAKRDSAASVTTAAAIACNFLILGFFKYAQFFVGNINSAMGTDIILRTVILPLGISFFTFEQIGFLSDVRRGRTRPSDLLTYALFVSFFPRLVAGPILRYDEIAPQLSTAAARPTSNDLAVGLTIFFIGLVKKAFLADGVAPYATVIFTAAGHGASQDLLLSWGGALAYTFQLYFDFSGYSDMAIGLARCFAIRFPMNFYSPYKSLSIIEFWRRWHISLSRFLRDYLYIPLGGSRCGPVRRYVNLMLTMLLGGLWHGASWTFVFWGGLHGIYLTINHLYAGLRRRPADASGLQRSMGIKAASFLVTFIAVVVAWVFFRAPTFEAAVSMLRGMVGLNGIALPAGLRFALSSVPWLSSALGVRYVYESGQAFITTYLWISALSVIAFFAPATQEWLAQYDAVLEVPGIMPVRPMKHSDRFKWQWTMSRTGAIVAGSAAFLGIISIRHASEFLYWQF